MSNNMQNPKKYDFDFTSAKRSFSSADYINTRSPYDRSVYEYYRPNEAIPNGNTQQDLRDIMIKCRCAYDRVGVIKSVVDMMSEFGAEGIEIIHPDAGPNAFYKNWAKTVKLEDRVERFLSWYFKCGNTVVRRNYGTITRQKLQSLKDSQVIDDQTVGGKIPIGYIFYDPATIEVVGDGYGSFVPKKRYAVRIPLTHFMNIRRPYTDLEKKIYNQLPQEMKDAIEGKATENGVFYVPIPEDKVYVACYKKDDSDLWAKSFIYSILSDVLYNDKLKTAKTSALDSWCNVIRLWKLGDHSVKLPPGPTDGERLASILEANTGGGGSDIIWNSAIQLEEFYPPVERLVNFEENINNILLGLGVPENLIGGMNTHSSSSNNSYLGLKNLIKRLEAGRRAVTDWLEEEITIINREMGFKKRPIIRFSHADLHDDQTYFNLLVQLLDRNVISDQTILERINEFAEIETPRIQTETTLRDDGVKPEKAGPFHKPDLESQQKHEINKIREQGKVAQQSTENSSNIQKQLRKETHKNGRPSGSRDKVSRKRGPNRIRTTSAKLLLEANKVFDFVDDYVRTSLLEKFAVSNVRKFTTEQLNELDSLRFNLFACIVPFGNKDEETVLANAQSNDCGDIIQTFKENFEYLLSELGSEGISFEEKKQIMLQAYINTWLDDGV